VEASLRYEQGRAERARELSTREAESRAIATARLALATVALGLLAGIVWWRLGAAGWAALGGIAAVFLVLVFVHGRVLDAAARASAALRFHERGLARIAHAWDRLPKTSERFRSADHPFAGDLDIFGKASLMQLVDATETVFGEEKLARLLSLPSVEAWPDDVQARQQAARDLASRFAFREALATAGGVAVGERPDAGPLLAWAEQKSVLPVVLAIAAWVLPAATLATIALGPALHAPATRITLVVLVQIALGVAAGARLTPMLAAASSRESAATRWREMIAAIEREPFDDTPRPGSASAPLLVTLRERLSSGRRKASEEIASLARIVGFVDARNNEVFRFLIGPLLFWDVHCAFALLRWRARAGAHLREWLDVLGEVEALASVAAFAFERPDFAWPELGPEGGLEARELGHPLIPAAARVGNDVHLPRPGRALVVTGSNMSGKSTLLRALGVNAVLANAGAPVCARSLRIGPARVATSMRVEDSLEQGVSHFYAEVRRLKRVLELARQPGPPVLFLLDEILHGTNSRERVIGACAVVRELLERGALGAVSTHDLGITALERELGGSVENVHFEEQVSGEAMTFDYVLRPGIVQSSNALRLMRAVGIDVPEPDAAE
jgi:hypothetical protein